MTRILMMSERRVIGRTPIFVIKYRTWRPRRTNQVAMSASNNRRAILVLFNDGHAGGSEPSHSVKNRRLSSRFSRRQTGCLQRRGKVKLGQFAAWEPHSPQSRQSQET